MRLLFTTVYCLCLAGCATSAIPARNPTDVGGAETNRNATRTTPPAAIATAAGLGTCLAKNKPTLFLNCYVPESEVQLKVLGEDAANVRVVMCLTCMDVYGDNQECHAATVQDYPTWIFPDGTRLTGVQSREALATAAKCAG